MIVIKPDVIGTRRVQYNNKDGKTISGFELHFVWESDDVVGQSAANAYFSDYELGGAVFKPGDKITLAFDPFNKGKRFSYLAL